MDITEAHVSIRNFITRQPYVADSGMDSLDLPFESCEWTEVMYEAKIGEISTAHVTFPSLIASPELRPLLQKIQEGDRVELFANQPDCGDPVFAGFIPPNGIIQDGGKVTIDVDDTLGQLRWQHLKRSEYLSGPASLLYTRAMGIWRDLVLEDFLGTNPAADYSTTTQGAASTLTWGSLPRHPGPNSGAVGPGGSGGFVGPTGFLTVAGTGGIVFVYPTYLASGFKVNPGDTFLMECDCTLTNLFTGSSFQELALMLGQIPIATKSLNNGSIGITVPDPGIQGFLIYQNPGVSGVPYEQWPDTQILGSTGFGYNCFTFTGGTNSATAIPMPQTHHLAAYVHFDAAGTVSVFVYLDNVNVAFAVSPWFYDATTYAPMLQIQSPSATETITLTSWRVSKLVPALIPAGRFNPQTIDALTYQPNNEENLQFLQLVAEKDNAEYRPIYQAWPSHTDELELDAAGTLGKFASRQLGYEQPSSLPSEGSPQASPAPVITDVASFLTAPPFRFEEGFNLAAPPKVLARANAHANDVIRVGASSIDAQTFAEKWSAAELGRPQHAASGALFPRFEQITNDDRVGIQSLVATLAQYELNRRVDATPSLEVTVVDEEPWAFRWRAGDQVFTKTQSLLTNIEQELRVVKVQYKAGSPERVVILGKTDWDPTQQRQLSESMKISWLYEQSGTNPGIYVYPFTGSINSLATSTDFTIPLDQYTTGSALVYAAIHWFADANVLSLAPYINGVALNNLPAGIIPAGGTDSGLIICTSVFQRPGSYSLHFKNNDGNARTLTGAFLVLRIKA
jgi:hypothetical protein